MTKTEQRILEAFDGADDYFYPTDGVVPLDGRRAVGAAKKLVAKGLAVWVREPYSYSYVASRNGIYGKTVLGIGAAVRAADTEETDR